MKAILFALSLCSLLAIGASLDAAEKYKFDDIVHMNCAEAWKIANEKENNVYQMVLVLGNHSLKARKLTFPDTKKAGDTLGDLIVAGCVWDPEANFYGIVDRSVRVVASPSK